MQTNNQPAYRTIDANEAVASVAYRCSEVIAIYPITPSSAMGEWAEAWAAEGQLNLESTLPAVVEMQSEGGAAGAVHGALQTGSLATTFTASQGLLLMIPNMYKIAGELLPTVFHVAARSLATQALSIFGDHSDVMSVRGTGWAMLSSANGQQAADFALVSHAASLESSVPFIHFFDGFRTSHEVSKITTPDNQLISAMIEREWVENFKQRALNPEKPVIRGTAQNPDVYFQGRETVNPYYAALPTIVQNSFDRFAALTGRQYNICDYYGAPDAEKVIVIMGSAAETVIETIELLNSQGQKLGLVVVRLFRPFPGEQFVSALPASCKAIAVLDRTKEPGAPGEPLYVDCVHALFAASASGSLPMERMPQVCAGRYGLSSKEFTPAMCKAVFDNLLSPECKQSFTIGIYDDVSHSSLPFDSDFDSEHDEVFRAMFYGLGSDGTVGANKDTIKIIGENTDLQVQGYFVYDSKKAGASTVSHLRFGPRPIRSTYLISKANFIALHQPTLLERFDILANAKAGAIFLMNSPYPAEQVWQHIPAGIQQQILQKDIKLWVIDAFKVARASGMGGRINVIMQTCFFALSGVLPQQQALELIKKSIAKTYAKKGAAVIERNIEAVNNTLQHLQQVDLANVQINGPAAAKLISDDAPDYVREVLGTIIAGKGDELPVSAMPVDGTFPTGTAQYEKRALALDIPVWEADLCIQCGKCVAVCPHAVIRSKAYDKALLAGAPEGFKSAPARLPDWKGMEFSIQVSPLDCTGCTLCVDVCPAKSKTEPDKRAINMAPIAPQLPAEEHNWDFFLNKIPDMPRQGIRLDTLRSMQVLRPLFEFSGACAGCGETPYLKMLSQLFGERLVIANATGCSSIYSGNLPTTPWATNDQGRGPAWANSLFEDNAEFGLGFRISLDKQQQLAKEKLQQMSSQLPAELVQLILDNKQASEADIFEQRQNLQQLKQLLADKTDPASRGLQLVVDNLLRKSVWIIGGDGWAYDIGYGGLDHVLASGKNVKVLVMDTEVYSNTGGQCSKATPRLASAKFATDGKRSAKKDLGLMAMAYENVYVASVAMGAKDEQTLKAFIEAEAYDGPAIIIAYSHCIAHGIDMAKGLQQQKSAVDAGQWMLYRYNPANIALGKNPLSLDSKPPKVDVETYLNSENRFRMLFKNDPETAKQQLLLAQQNVNDRWALYQALAARFNNQQPAADK